MAKTLTGIAAGAALLGIALGGAGSAFADEPPVTVNASGGWRTITVDFANVTNMRCGVAVAAVGNISKVADSALDVTDGSSATGHYETVPLAPGNYRVRAQCVDIRDGYGVLVEHYPPAGGAYPKSESAVRVGPPDLEITLPTAITPPPHDVKIVPMPPDFNPPPPLEQPAFTH